MVPSFAVLVISVAVCSVFVVLPSPFVISVTDESLVLT